MLARVFYQLGEHLASTYGRSDIPTDPRRYALVGQLEAEDHHDVFDLMNHGSHRECPLLLTGNNGQPLRSMSVGDIVYIGDIFWLCKSLGWAILIPNKFTLTLYRKVLTQEV